MAKNRLTGYSDVPTQETGDIHEIDHGGKDFKITDIPNGLERHCDRYGNQTEATRVSGAGQQFNRPGREISWDNNVPRESIRARDPYNGKMGHTPEGRTHDTPLTKGDPIGNVKRHGSFDESDERLLEK
jgi:hypothetical protein